jgi:hypothetical protein
LVAKGIGPGDDAKLQNCALAMSIWTLGLSIMQEEQQKYKTQCNKKSVPLHTCGLFDMQQYEPYLSI